MSVTPNTGTHVITGTLPDAEPHTSKDESADTRIRTSVWLATASYHSILTLWFYGDILSTPSGWEAEVLPLNYTRLVPLSHLIYYR